jgi:hypothetical protein
LTGLLTLLDRLERMHRDLLEVIRDKIERMRASDLDGMRDCIAREATLVQAITEQEGLRRQLMVSMGQEMGIAPHQARAMHVRELARRIDPSRREPLLAAAERLRGTVARVAEANRVAGLIAREILRHFRHVFAAMTCLESGPGGYTPRGYRQTTANQALLDAVG